MDTGRFDAELPVLFDDFPRPPAPRGRHFDDVVDQAHAVERADVAVALGRAAGSATILESDAFEVIGGGRPGDRPVGVS
jgi:hypothetical protein